MDIKKLQSLVVDALEDVKAQDIVVFDTTGLTSLFDRICIASGTSNRQTRALAASVRDKVKEAGGDIIGVEGEDTGEWVLVDLGDIIVHIMQAPIRAYYRLEEIWGEKPVKLGAAKRKTSTEGKAAEAIEAAPKKTGHLAANKIAKAAEPVIEKKAVAARKPGTAKVAAAAGAAAAAAKKAPAKKATPKVVAPEGKKVKVAAPKASVASAKAAKESKSKDPNAPTKTVIKRIKKPAAEE